MTAKVVAINISEKKGVIKHPVPMAQCVPDYGIMGDAHAGRGIRQVSLLGVESVAKLEKVKNIKGLCHGQFAENITTQGITLYELPVGTKLKIGETVHEISQIGKKCHADQGCEIARLYGYCVMPLEGIFTKVMVGGVIKTGDSIEII